MAGELPTNPQDAKQTRVELTRIRDLLPEVREAARAGASDETLLDILRGTRTSGEVVDVPGPVAAAAGVAPPSQSGAVDGPGADVAGALNQILAELIMHKQLLTEIRDIARAFANQEGLG